MTVPIQQELAEDLHALSFREAISCDYHHRPREIKIEERVLIEAIKLIDHPQLQLDQWPSGWVLDVARCTEHSVEEIQESTRGFEEALVEISVTTTNDVVSIDTPTSDELRVLAYTPATEGSIPMLLSQQLMDAAEPGDMGLSRWTRVKAMLGGGPSDSFSEHVESLIDRSAEVPSSFESSS